MNIRFTVSKVSPNDHLKLSQSRNVRATLELFAGHKSTSQIAPGICKIFSIPAPYGTISVIVGLAAFPRTNYLWAKVRITAQTGSSKRSNLTKGIGEKNGEELKESFVPRTSRRKKSGGARIPACNDNVWFYSDCYEPGNYRPVRTNNAGNCQSPQLRRSMISRRSLKVSGSKPTGYVQNCEQVTRVRPCFFELKEKWRLRCMNLV